MRSVPRRHAARTPQPCGAHPCHATHPPPVTLHARPCHAARPPCHAARAPLSCCAPPPVTLHAPPLSCCAQSQHPVTPVERSESEVAGLRDCARNDEVEGTTLCGTHPPVMRRAKDAAPGSQREHQRGWSSAASRRSKRCVSRLRASRSVSRFSGRSPSPAAALTTMHTLA